MPAYQTALLEVSAAVCANTARQAEELVFKRKLLKLSKAQESGEGAARIGQQMSRLRRQAHYSALHVSFGMQMGYDGC